MIEVRCLDHRTLIDDSYDKHGKMFFINLLLTVNVCHILLDF